jgi:hypothetical protein
VPFELDCDVFCFPPAAAIAGEAVAGEPLMFALTIEPSKLLAWFGLPSKDAVPETNLAGDFDDRGNHLWLRGFEMLFAGESVGDGSSRR